MEAFPTTTIQSRNQTFTCFPKLPLELRLKIWREALPGRRIVEIRTSHTSRRDGFHRHPEQLWDNPQTISPPHSRSIYHIMQACKESYAIASKRYWPILDPHQVIDHSFTRLALMFASRRALPGRERFRDRLNYDDDVFWIRDPAVHRPYKWSSYALHEMRTIAVERNELILLFLQALWDEAGQLTWRNKDDEYRDHLRSLKEIIIFDFDQGDSKDPSWLQQYSLVEQDIEDAIKEAMFEIAEPLDGKLVRTALQLFKGVKLFLAETWINSDGKQHITSNPPDWMYL
ncbi:hypothetical protein B0J14DRAFT_245553 [Halenospora varia]|nr:hypothetical protein B0J14DRAFT_245553 [Halenospora varia]